MNLIFHYHYNKYQQHHVNFIFGYNNFISESVGLYVLKKVQNAQVLFLGTVGSILCNN